MNNSGYFSNFINMFKQYNLTSLDAESLGNNKGRRYTTEIREKYLFFGGTALKLKKLEFIKLLKMNIIHLIISTS